MRAGVMASPMRKSSAGVPEVKFMDAIGVELGKLLRERFDVRRLAMESMELATGRIAECPITANIIEEGRGLIFLALEYYAGAVLDVRGHVLVTIQIDLAAIQELLLRISGDPDYKAFCSSSQSFGNGVRLGVGATCACSPLSEK